MPNHHGRTRPSLTSKQILFVEEYLVDLSATQAAIRAGYSPRTAASIGNENLRKPEIKVAISDAKRARSLRTGIAADLVVQELARIAFSNILKVLSWGPDGIFVKASSALSDADAAMISEVTHTRDGSIRIKLHSKLAALDMLARHLGLYDPPQSPRPTAPQHPLLTTTGGERAKFEEMLRECLDQHEAEHEQLAIGHQRSNGV